MANGSGSYRASTRLSLRPKRSYAPAKVRAPMPVERVGTRRSARISDGKGSRRRSSGRESDDDDEEAETQSQRVPPTLKLQRLQNPRPPSASSGEEMEGEREYARAPLPTRDANGNILFENAQRHFMPNLTPEEMLKGGVFGGTAFRPFHSSVTKAHLSGLADLEEFPAEWYEGLDRDTQLLSTQYDAQVNRFRVKAGQSLEEWERSGWIRTQDPRGWWQVSGGKARFTQHRTMLTRPFWPLQWYFRFYLGRRTSDDARQISRFSKACGPNGRFKRTLVAKIHGAGASFDDESISPVIRQTLFHWAYILTQADYEAYLP